MSLERELRVHSLERSFQNLPPPTVFRYFSTSLNTLYRTQDQTRRLRNSLVVSLVAALGTIPLLAFVANHYFPVSGAILVPLLVLMILATASFEYRKALHLDRRIAFEIRFLLFHSKNRLGETIGLGNSIWSECHLYELFRQDFYHAGVDVPYERAPVTRRRLYDATLAKLCPSWSSLLPFLVLTLIWILVHLPERIPSVITEGVLKYNIALAAVFVALTSEIVGVAYRMSLFARFTELRDHVIQMLEDVHQHHFSRVNMHEYAFVSRSSEYGSTGVESTAEINVTLPPAPLFFPQALLSSPNQLVASRVDGALDDPTPVLEIAQSVDNLFLASDTEHGTPPVAPVPPPIPAEDFDDSDIVFGLWELDWEKKYESSSKQRLAADWQDIISGFVPLLMDIQFSGDGQGDSLSIAVPVLSLTESNNQPSFQNCESEKSKLPVFISLSDCLV